MHQLAVAVFSGSITHFNLFCGIPAGAVNLHGLPLGRPFLLTNSTKSWQISVYAPIIVAKNVIVMWGYCPSQRPHSRSNHSWNHKLGKRSWLPPICSTKFANFSANTKNRLKIRSIQHAVVDFRSIKHTPYLTVFSRKTLAQSMHSFCPPSTLSPN